MTEVKITNGVRDLRRVIILVALLVVGIIIVGAVNIGNRPPVSTTPAATTSDNRPTEATPKPPRPIDLKAEGNAATDKFQLNSGLATFKFTYKGTGNFIVYLLDNEGNELDLVANEVDSTTGSYATRINASGTYLLNVKADGPWTVNITQ